MRAPNSRHSDPRNTHIASFSLETPVLVWWLGDALVVQDGVFGGAERSRSQSSEDAFSSEPDAG